MKEREVFIELVKLPRARHHSLMKYTSPFLLFWNLFNHCISFSNFVTNTMCNRIIGRVVKQTEDIIATDNLVITVNQMFILLVLVLFISVLHWTCYRCHSLSETGIIHRVYPSSVLCSPTWLSMGISNPRSGLPMPIGSSYRLFGVTFSDGSTTRRWVLSIARLTATRKSRNFISMGLGWTNSKKGWRGSIRKTSPRYPSEIYAEKGEDQIRTHVLTIAKLPSRRWTKYTYSFNDENTYRHNREDLLRRWSSIFPADSQFKFYKRKQSVRF